MKKISIYDYYEYRLYLKDWFSEKKIANPRWSYNLLSRSIDVKNNSTILKVISGERNLGPNLADKLSKYLKLDRYEKAYFLDMIKLDQFKDNSKLGGLIKRNLRSLSEEQKIRQVDLIANIQNPVSSWFYILRVLLDANILDQETLRLNKGLRIPLPGDFEKIIEELLSKNLLVRENGKYRVSDEHLETKRSDNKESLRAIHLDFIELAKSVLSNIEFESRVLYSTNYTVVVKKADYQKIVTEIAEAFRFIVNQYCVDDEVPVSDKDVYLLQSQFFPLTVD